MLLKDFFLNNKNIDGEKLIYALILSWFYLLTFNLLKIQLYSANDRLGLNFKKTKRDLLMINAGNEYAQNNKRGDP